MKRIIFILALIQIVIIGCNDNKGIEKETEVNRLNSQLFFGLDNLKDFPNLYETPSDSLITDIMNRTPFLKSLGNNNSYYNEIVLKDSTFYTDLNGDGKMDMLMYIDGFWNGDGIEIYLDKDGSFEKVYSRSLFKLSKVFKPITPHSVFYLSSVQYHHSSWPFLASYSEVTILKNSVIEDITYFYEGTEFPAKITINKPFRVTQDKYNLRKTPLIDNRTDLDYSSEGQKGNIILELAKGDEGVAFAEYKDKTGRIWWFVQIKNNINKSLSSYYYINAEGEKHRMEKGYETTLDKSMFGWISSNFIEPL